jgi:ribosomal protein L20A (L18A)
MQKEINHNLIIIFQTQEETSESKEEEVTKLGEYKILEQTYERVGSRILN